jgi:hypothetical protein
VDRLEISARMTQGVVDLLLIESPEPLAFSEDVTLRMVHLQSSDPVRLAILSDGTESRAYAVPVAESGDPIVLSPGDYELTWMVARNRYRGSGADPNRSLHQVAKTTLTIQPGPQQPKKISPKGGKGNRRRPQ